MWEESPGNTLFSTACGPGPCTAELTELLLCSWDWAQVPPEDKLSRRPILSSIPLGPLAPPTALTALPTWCRHFPFRSVSCFNSVWSCQSLVRCLAGTRGMNFFKWSPYGAGNIVKVGAYPKTLVSTSGWFHIRCFRSDNKSYYRFSVTHLGL